MAVDRRPACPVHADFDPRSPEFPADPYVVSRYADIEAVFLDPETYSAGAA